MTRFRGVRSLLRPLVPALGALVVLSGCALADPTHQEAAGRPDAPAPDASLAMSFGQLPSQIGTNRGLLRVVNAGHGDLVVRRVGLDWRGYGPLFLQPEDNTLRPGETVDFPIALPSPDCGDGSGEVLGVVDTGGVRLRSRLDHAGTVLLRRARNQACVEEFVHDRLDIEYVGSWRVTGTGPTAAVTGELRVARRTGNETVRLVGVEGSVLYDLELPGATTLPADASERVVPLRITPGNRCDEHALSQATAPFAFRLTLRIGGQRGSVSLVPSPEVQAKLPAVLERACS